MLVHAGVREAVKLVTGAVTEPTLSPRSAVRRRPYPRWTCAMSIGLLPVSAPCAQPDPRTHPLLFRRADTPSASQVPRNVCSKAVWHPLRAVPAARRARLSGQPIPLLCAAQHTALLTRPSLPRLATSRRRRRSSHAPPPRRWFAVAYSISGVRRTGSNRLFACCEPHTRS